jgi:homogentisate 1,2-dioxygenase
MHYQTGFGNFFESEAIEGSLPGGRNSPRKPLKGLIPEQLSGSAFTMQRSENLRSWLYRIHPSTFHGPYSPFVQKTWVSKFASERPASPERFRWKPMEEPTEEKDFVEGVFSMVTTADSKVAVHNYAFNKAMGERVFYNADGELVFIPVKGEISVVTELGVLEAGPQEIVVVPRGIKFQVNPKQKGLCKGYLGENMGAPLTLPNLGPIGSNGLANPRDFKFPVAHYKNKKQSYQVVSKFHHHFWQYEVSHCPLDVVAWHGNYAPYKYDLRSFNTMGTVSYDHPDPSIYTVLTSPTSTPGLANVDFVIFPPRWLVGENTFRPPYYHRNFMNEYMGLIEGVYDAKEEGFLPGGSSLHNRMSAHGPDTETFHKAIKGDDKPEKVDQTMAFMFETSQVFQPTAQAMNADFLDKDYYKCWQKFEPLFGEQ